MVLFPEATLPLRVVQPHFIAAVEQAMTQVEAPYTIGVVSGLLVMLPVHVPLSNTCFTCKGAWFCGMPFRFVFTGILLITRDRDLQLLGPQLR